MGGIQISHILDEQQRIFRFTFILRVIGLLIALIQLLKDPTLIFNATVGITIWVSVLLYTVLLYARWQQVFNLIIRNAFFLAIDVMISALLLLLTKTLETPFYFYAYAPLISAAFFYRLRGALIVSSLLTICHASAHFINGGTIDIFSSGQFGAFIGSVSAFMVIGPMLVYPGKLIVEVVKQQAIIKEKTEREAISEERARFARELHDNLAQLLTAIKIKANAVSKKASVIESDSANQLNTLISLAIQDLRNAIFALRPENTEKDICSMLTDYCRRSTAIYDCKIETYFNTDGLELGTEQKYEILCICQEAIANATRHAGVKTITLEVENNHEGLIISVKDTGVGFNPSEVDAGVGLFSMRERAEKLAGSLLINSAPNTGTQVKLSVPLASLGVRT